MLITSYIKIKNKKKEDKEDKEDKEGKEGKEGKEVIITHALVHIDGAAIQ